MNVEQDLLRADACSNKVLFWECGKALSVSGRDLKLPKIDQALRSLKTIGWPVHKRKTGGTAFPIAPGILNVSILRDYSTSQTNDVIGKYQSFTDWILRGLESLKLNFSVGHTEGSFCDGSYNLMIDGRKFVGTSQQWCRLSNGSSRHLFHCAILVSADIEELVNIVNMFYSKANPGGKLTVSEDSHSNIAEYYPQITVSSIANLISKTRLS